MERWKSTSSKNRPAKSLKRQTEEYLSLADFFIRLLEA